jgi:hypothetical protein
MALDCWWNRIQRIYEASSCLAERRTHANNSKGIRPGNSPRNSPGRHTGRRTGHSPRNRTGNSQENSPERRTGQGKRKEKRPRKGPTEESPRKSSRRGQGKRPQKSTRKSPSQGNKQAKASREASQSAQRSSQRHAQRRVKKHKGMQAPVRGRTPAQLADQPPCMGESHFQGRTQRPSFCCRLLVADLLSPSRWSDQPREATARWTARWMRLPPSARVSAEKESMEDGQECCINILPRTSQRSSQRVHAQEQLRDPDTRLQPGG